MHDQPTRWRRRPTIRLLGTIAAGALVVVATARGGGASGSGVATLGEARDGADAGGAETDQGEESFEDALLAFARCMREQGIDMPDPGAGGFIEARPDDPVDPFSEEFQKAQEACREHLQALPTPQDASGGQP